MVNKRSKRVMWQMFRAHKNQMFRIEDKISEESAQKNIHISRAAEKFTVSPKYS